MATAIAIIVAAAIIAAVIVASAAVFVKIVGFSSIVAPGAPVSVVPVATIPIHWATFEIRRLGRRNVSGGWIVFVLSLGSDSHETRRNGPNTHNDLEIIHEISLHVSAHFAEIAVGWWLACSRRCPARVVR